jgi:hypothetical protein
MTTPERLFAQLTTLCETGRLTKSQCGTSLLKTLRPLIATSVVVEERSGAGRRLTVRDRPALELFINQYFPNKESDENAPSRVAGVHRFRDTKAFSSDNPSIIQVRAWRGDVLLKNAERVDADTNTRAHSVFSFQNGTAYSLNGPCALVENPALFNHFEQLELKIDLVIYGQGRISNQLLTWLANQSNPKFSLLHLPDYDPTGINEFQRLRGMLGRRVNLYLPDGLEQLFARYSNRHLLQKQNTQVLLSNLRRSGSPEVQRVIRLIDDYGAGLEQEVLLSR